MNNSTNRFRRPPGRSFRPSTFRPKQRHRSFDPTSFINKSNLPVLTEVGLKVESLSNSTNAFSDFLISDKLKRNIAHRGYTTPTPIQGQAIPQILAGRDVVGIANTGTGKTGAFLIPLIHKASLDRSYKVLIIAPTRELAVQIRDELQDFSQGFNIDSVLCIGGVGIFPQAQRLLRNPQFVIGTPGRLRDLERNRKLNYAGFKAIVLDEVDRMLDIGFVAEVKHIILSLPRNRHSLFFSATLTQDVQEIMRGFLNNPVTISVKIVDNLENVRQEIIKTNGRLKIEVLRDLLIKEGFIKVLVFGRTKHGMEKLARELTARGFKVASIHGNKSQSQRQRALNDFKNNQVQVLLATDIASRGLDIDDVTHVINYDLPETYEAYIHRIGRTGRANKLGTALTFLE